MKTITKKELSNKEDKFIEKAIDIATVSSETEKQKEICNSTKLKLAQHVKRCFDSSDSARRDIELNWTDALRQYKGIYSPEVLNKIGKNRSKANIRITRTKVKTVDSRLVDLLFPANGEKNWSIEATPLPQLSIQEIESIQQVYLEQTGQPLSKAELDVTLSDLARTKSDNMAKVIEDQLSELKYREVMRNVVHSGNLYGTGILKGPLVSITESTQYSKRTTDSGKEKWVMQEHDTLTPFIEHVRIWDVYPDMEAETVDTCRYIIQRRKMDKHALVDLAKRSDFSGEEIRDYLARNANGDYKKKTFEINLTDLGDIINNSSYNNTKKYEVLEFWGFLDSKDLNAIGVDMGDCADTAGVELMANIWVLGDKVIKSSLSPMDGVKYPYFFYYYDKDETSIFGQGIPAIMKDVQELINSSFRAMLDNAAISAGPQVEVNLSLLSEDEDPRDFYPFKVWLRTGEGTDAANPAIRPIQFQSYTPEFERMIELFRNYGDEVTSIPRFMWGEGTQVPTNSAASLSMLLGSANITIKDQVRNFDDGITKPFISAMYHWNMQFSDDEDVKGDYNIVAKGTSSLVAKEIRSQSLMTFAQLTSNPLDSSSIKRTNLIRAIADSLDLDDHELVLSDQEIQMQQQQAQQAQEEERAFMTSIIETAREQGTSPTAMLDSLKALQDTITTPEQQVV